MKSWMLAASLLVALSLPAAAAPADEPVNIGQMVEFLGSKMAERCAGTPASDILNHALSCTCGPQALDVAWPAAGRAGSSTRDAILSRMGGAMNVCIARSVKQLIADPCAHGIDPFADDAAPSPPALAAERCKCANAELDKAAAGDPAKEAEAASARFAAGQPTSPAPNGVLARVQAACVK